MDLPFKQILNIHCQVDVQVFEITLSGLKSDRGGGCVATVFICISWSKYEHESGAQNAQHADGSSF